MIINEGGSGGKKLPILTNPGAAGDLLENKQLIDANGNILTGTMPTVDHPNPTISVGANGLITASHAQGSGKVTGGTTTATRQLTTQGGTTITPGTTQKTAVASGRYTTGPVYVAGSSNLVASNIKSGVNIFGVNGTYSGDSLHYEWLTVYSRNIASSDFLTFNVTLSNAPKQLLGILVAPSIEYWNTQYLPTTDRYYLVSGSWIGTDTSSIRAYLRNLVCVKRDMYGNLNFDVDPGYAKVIDISGKVLTVGWYDTGGPNAIYFPYYSNISYAIRVDVVYTL